MFGEKYNAQFQEEVKFSKIAVGAVAKWLRRCGDEVIDWSGKQTLANNYGEFQDHTDSGDIWWRTVKGEGEWHRLEVKRRKGVHFTTSETWPRHLRDGPYVCACHVWDHADPKIWGIMSLNWEMTHYLFIRPETHMHWTDRMVRDERVKARQRTYVCPLKYVTFHPIQLEE